MIRKKDNEYNTPIDNILNPKEIKKFIKSYNENKENITFPSPLYEPLSEEQIKKDWEQIKKDMTNPNIKMHGFPNTFEEYRARIKSEEKTMRFEKTKK